MKGKTTLSYINNTAMVEAQCGVTGHVYRITVPLHKWMDWKQGEQIQKAFPNLLPEEREIMQTGITPAEWNQMFNA